jgi:hypothetical protein
MTTIHPNTHEKLEWARLAESALSSAMEWEKLGASDNSARLFACARHFLSMATMPEGSAILLSQFDELQDVYRTWLNFNVITWTESEVTA